MIAKEGVPVQEWNRIVEESPNGLIFHLSDWLDILESTQRIRLIRYGLYSDQDGNELVGVFPVFVGHYGPIRVAGSPLIVEDTPYMGPVCADHLLIDALRATQVAVRKEASYFRALLHCTLSEVDCSQLQSEGFVCITKHTHKLDLTKGIESVWKNMEGRCRTSVRKAEKAEIAVTKVSGLPEGFVALSSYYRLVDDVYHRQKRQPPNPLELFRRLWEKLYLKGMLSLFMARLHGRDIGGILLAHYKGRVYYLDGASDRQFAAHCATNLLLWKAIQWSNAEGYREFDFVGSDIPRLSNFKASFGGELTSYLCLEHANSPYLRVLRRWYGSWGKLMLRRVDGLIRKALLIRKLGAGS